MFVWIRQKVHVSWFIAIFCMGILVGVSAAFVFKTTFFVSILWLIIALVLFSFVLFQKFRIFLLIALVAGCLVGVWRGGREVALSKAYVPLYGSTIQMTGVISEDITKDESGLKKGTLTNITVGDQKLVGKVWFSTSSKLELKRSDHIELSGKLKEGFGSFQASMTYTSIKKVERISGGDVARDARDWFADSVKKAIPDPEASLGLGYLLGLQAGLPADLGDALKIVGLTHIVVASGYNLTILVRFARRFFAKYSKYVAALAALCMIGAFILITGASPSMTRAGLVAGISLLAWYYGRKTHPFVLLSFAAALTVLINPFYLSGDLGWYLSFVAFFGVIVVAPLTQRYFWGDEKPKAMRQIFVDTFSAQLVTFPIIALAFGSFSVFALPANMLILPFVPIAMLLTFLAGLGGVLIPAFAEAIGWPAYVILKAMINLSSWIASLPGASGQIAMSLFGLVLFYGVLLGLVWFFKKQTKYNFRDANIVE